MRKIVFSILSRKIFLGLNLLLIFCLILFQSEIDLGPLGYFWALFLSLITFWASGWDWSFFGLASPRWKSSMINAIFWAFGIFLVVDILVQPIIEHFFGIIDLSSFDWLKGNILGYLLFALFMWVMAAIGEEVIFRGYIQKRIADLLGDSNNAWWLSVIFSSILFGLAHLYQGASGVISTGMIGFVFAIIFMKNRQTLVLTMLIHGFYDMIGLTLLFLDKERIFVDPMTKLLFGN